MTGAMNLAGNLTNSGAALTLSQPVNFNGNTTVTGSASVTISSATSSVAASSTLALGAVTFANTGTLTITGNLQINQGGFPGGAGAYSYNSTTGTLVFNNTAGSFAVNNDNYWPTVNGPQNVTVQGSGGITMNVARTIGTSFQYAAGVSGAANLTLNTLSQINAGGFVSGSPTYGAGTLLKYNTGGTYGRNGEWLPGVISGAGYPHHVRLSNNTTLDLPNSSSGSTFQMAGDLTIDAGSTMQLAGSTPLTQTLTIFGSVTNNGTFNLSTAAGGNLNVGGSWTNNATFNNNGRTVNLNGSIGQTVSGNSTFFDLTKSSATSQTLTFAAGSTQTVTNALTLNAVSPQILSLRSTVTGTQWKLNAPATQSVSFVDVKDSDASGGATVNAASSIDSGNNLNWNFPSAAETDVAVSGGNLVVTDVNGGTTNDRLALSLNAGSVRVNDPSHTLAAGAGAVQIDANTVDVPLASITGNIQLNTLGGDDDVTLSFTSGNFLPAGGLNYAGGTQTGSPGDRLAIVGGSQGTVTYNYSNLNDGNIVMSAFGTVTYTSLEPIFNNGSATDIIFNMPPAGALAILEDDGVSGNGISRLNSAGNFETTTFANPSGSVTLNRGSAGDMFAAHAAPDFTASLTVGTVALPFNAVAFDDALTLATNKSLTVEASSQINLDPLADLSTTGSGTVSLNGRNIIFASGSSISVANGNLTLTANSAGTAAGNFRGLEINGSTLTTSGTGNISLTGKGGVVAGAGNRAGILMTNGAVISSTSAAAGAGTITLDGTGGLGTQLNNGVEMTDPVTAITSIVGNISITGHAGTGTASTNVGVQIELGSVVRSTGAAKITINGTGGPTAVANSRGIGVRVSNDGSQVTSSGGDISITGHGANGGAGNFGVSIAFGGLINSTGGAKITMDGTAGTGTNSLSGVIVSNFDVITDAPSRVLSDSGDIQITGHAGNGSQFGNIGINIDTSAKVAATGFANITLTGFGANGTSDCYGVGLEGGDKPGTAVSTLSGNINITGTGGSSAGTDMDGVRFEDSVGAEAVSVSTFFVGALTITGTAGNSDPTSSGINIVDDTTMSFSGASTFIADTMDFGNSNVMVGSGVQGLSLFQKTNGRLINLGGADSATELGLTDAELDVIGTDTLFIGNSNTGAITVTAPISTPVSNSFALLSGANIDISGGSITTAGANVLLTPGTNVFPSNSGVDVTTAAAAPVTLAALKALKIVINNTTVDSGYTQFNVAGKIDISGVVLQLSGSPVLVGGETFTIVNNDLAEPISGTFNLLPEGAVIPNFLGSGLNAKITYVGGSNNNDVVLTVVPCPSSFTVNNNGDASDVTPGDGICATSGAVCTLRAAIQEANASGSCGTINIGFSIPSSTITVFSELTISHAMNINGPTTATIVVAATPASPTRIFHIFPGQTVSISYLTVTGGRAVGFGGGLVAQGPSSNTTLTGMLFTGNTAVDSTGVAGGGGAATINGGTLTIINSTFSANTGTNGGGILILGGGPLNLINATVTNNNADGNTGAGPCGVDGDGGGIGGPTMPVSGISLRNTIVAGNQDCNSNNPNVTVSGGFLNLSNNLTSGDPLLMPLANNGGPTFTHALQSLSPAIDSGNNCVFDNTCVPAVGVALTTDQRGPGFSRKVNGNPNPDIVVDIGAFERQTPSATSSTISGRIVDSSGDAVEGAAVRMAGTQGRLTVTDSEGNYHFDEVETGGFYTITPSRLNFTFAPVERSFSQLGQHTDAVFTASDTAAGANPLDETVYFVRQQYLDFLGREPDEAGLTFWVNNINSCGANGNCLVAKRDDTSAAFFLSIEFQQTGYLVYRMYQSSFGYISGSPVPLRLAEFRPDTALIGKGVIVNGAGWQARLEANKQAFASEFVSRARFTTAYPATMTPASFVDKLLLNAGVVADVDRAAAIAEFAGAIDTANLAARARALRRVAENDTFAQQESNRAFVLMQYFGYLGRDPNAGPDTDYSGYNFWLNKLDSFNGDFRQAEMVKAFVVAGEYRGRFPR
jgi:hypothetical protein